MDRIDAVLSDAATSSRKRRAYGRLNRAYYMLRICVFAFEPGDRWFRVDAVVDPFEPSIEEPNDLVELIDVRAGVRR